MAINFVRRQNIQFYWPVINKWDEKSMKINDSSSNMYNLRIEVIDLRSIFTKWFDQSLIIKPDKNTVGVTIGVNDFVETFPFMCFEMFF